MSNGHEANPTPRVAVVAIHGVADQQPGNTAHRISNLLLMHRPQAYTGFVETDVRIGVQAVHMGSRTDEEEAEAASGQSTWDTRVSRMFEQITPRSKAVRRAQRQAIQRAQGDTPGAPDENFQHSYMREQLQEYRPQGNDAVYESVRLAGACLPPPAGDESVSRRERRDVHIFEMYWADLSRATGGLHRLVVEFYLLLFFLCSLGRHSIEFARVRFAKAKQAKWWRRFAGWQICAEGLLVLSMPILNLCLLGLGATMLPKHLDKLVSAGSRYTEEFYYELAANVLLGMVAAATTGLWLYRKRERWSGKVPWPFSVLALGAGSFLVWLVVDWIFRDWNPLVRLTGLVWLLSAGAIFRMMQAYQKRKPGAVMVTGIALVFVSLVLFSHPQFRPKADVHDLLNAIMFAGEACFVALCLCWLAFSLCYWGLCVTGFLAVRSVKREDAEARDAARRVRWTVHLTLVLPAVVMALANVVLWRSLLTVLQRFIPDDGKFYYPELLERWLNGNTLVKFAEKMVELTAGPYFTYAYLFLALVTAVFLWSLLPVLLTELRVPPHKETEWLGLCLDRAYKVARAPGIAMALVIALMPVLYGFTIWDPHYEKVWPAWMGQNPGVILTIAGSTLLLIVLGSKLPFKAPGKVLRNAIDIALDITNWLRLNPKQTNPKARISARFVSLLRHLHNWRDPDDGSAYSGIVIIAHSQGTVIAAEVLRFIAEEASTGARDPLLAGFGKEIPIYLFTMGSPLRQLYSLRFPHHYGWARHAGESNGERMPDPRALLVEKWVNVYRSADYVGRHLWRSDTGSERWEINKQDVDTRRREWCLGAGAHNHYWDETAAGVAEELDALIAEAAARLPNPHGRNRPVAITGNMDLNQPAAPNIRQA